MSYSVTLNKKLPAQGVYDQLLGGHIEDRKLMKLFPRAGSGPYGAGSAERIQFRLPDQGHIDTLRSYMTFDVRVHANLRESTRYASLGKVDEGLTSSYNYDLAELYDASDANDARYLDYLAYIPGGFNGSTASFFSRFQAMFDNESVEDIHDYHGLAAMLNMNIPDDYRTSATGHLQFLSPRGSREMVLNALVRGDSELLRVETATAGGDPFNSFGVYLSGADASGQIKTGDAHGNVTTTYGNLMHLPVSGIMSNSKLLPTKFLPPVDLEFTTAPAVEALQIASGMACANGISVAVGAGWTGVPRLNNVRAGVGGGTTLLGLHSSDCELGKVLWDLYTALLEERTNYTARGAALRNPTQGATTVTQNMYRLTLNPTVAASVRYEIVNPVYHVELVYMSEQYDAAFASALMRGVTYAYDTYTHASSTIERDGLVQIPLTKTSVKSIHTGFVNSTIRDSMLSNYWHFTNPDLQEYQLRFGSKLIPQEPVRVADDSGLHALMLYLKSTGLHYNLAQGLKHTWAQGQIPSTSTIHRNHKSLLAPEVVRGVLGASADGPDTWCAATGKWNDETDVHTALGSHPATSDLRGIASDKDVVAMSRQDTGIPGRISFRPEALHHTPAYLACQYAYGVGSFALGLDLEAEQGTVSGYNTSMTTSMMSWELKFARPPAAKMNVHTWLRHDKALRLEPYGKVTVVVD